MRISSLEIFNIANNSMQKSNADLVKTQQQLSTGQRVIRPSDDPVATIQILELTNELSRLEQYDKNINIAANSLEQQEGLLNGVNEIITRLMELSAQAGNTAVYTKSQYSAMATEVESRLDELVSIANSRNAGGDYVFAGFKTATEPFIGSTDAGFKYLGDDGQREIKIANNSKLGVSLSGRDVFVEVPSAEPTVRTYLGENNSANSTLQVSVGRVADPDIYQEFYPKDLILKFNDPADASPVPGPNFTITERSTGNVIIANQNFVQGQDIEVNGVKFSISGTPSDGDVVHIDSANQQSIMDTMAAFAKALRAVDDNSQSKQELAAVVASTLNNLDNAQVNVLQAFSALGAKQNTLQTTRDLHLDTTLFAKEVLSSLQNLDYAEASTRLSMQTTILEASQASFVRISRLSLFNRL